MRTTTLMAILVLGLAACGDATDLESSSNQQNDSSQQNDDNDQPTDNAQNDPNNDNDQNTDNYDLPDVRDHTGPIGPADREVEPIFPDDYDVEGDHPLLFLLHGYGSSADATLAGFNAGDEADARGVVKLAPEGLEDSTGQLYWNATDSCCDFEQSGVDDVAYLTELIDEAIHSYAIDPDRIYFLGISNGAMMSHRMACERGDLIDSIVSFNGSSTRDAADCSPEYPTNIFHVHGTEDEMVDYDGNALFPGAEEVVQRWAGWNECDPDPVDGPSVNVTLAVDGDETDIQKWQGCTDGGDVELWTMNGADHVPLPLADFGALMFDAIM